MNATMTAAPVEDPTTQNQRGLMRALAQVRSALRGHAGVDATEPSDTSGPGVARAAALDTVCAAFGLTPFERSVLLLCAGVELDGDLGALCAAAHGDPARPFPTFGLALAALPDAHWSALSPSAALRRWHLVDVIDPSALTSSRLRVDEYVLHLLAGAPGRDPLLAGLEPVAADPHLPPSLQARAATVGALWRQTSTSGPVPGVVGRDPAARRSVVAYAAAAAGLRLLAFDPAGVRPDPAEVQTHARLLERTCALEGAALLVELGDTHDVSNVAAKLIDELTGPVAVSVRQHAPAARRRVVAVDVGRPTAAEQRELWSRLLEPGDNPERDEELDRLAGAFDLDSATIATTAVVARSGAARSVWAACRATTSAPLDQLAGRVEPSAGWEDLVLPAGTHELLRAIASHARNGLTVYETWGMRRGSRGLGTAALFTGPSGTGKTMAAEVLAADLALDLNRVDLSAVISKYIGETEKNLQQVFDAAEDGGTVLLFDEADALFGRRTEVKDSHDRYANVEISYLLQRMEDYRGLALLTTNFPEALDAAFLRRIRFVVTFPFPDADLRTAMWRRAFPASTPTADLDIDRLGRLNLTGGSIRTIAVNAAFLAAADHRPVGMPQVLRAARMELAKLGQSTVSLDGDVI